MKKKVDLQTIKGSSFTAELTVIREFRDVRNNLDGNVCYTNDYVEKTRCQVKVMEKTLTGSFQTSSMVLRISPAGTFALLKDAGVVLCLDEANYNLYKDTLDSMIALEESKPEVKKHLEKRNANEKDCLAYDKHKKAVDNMMTLSGHTN